MYGNRNTENRDDALEFTPSRSHLTESTELCTTPGSVVWAKTDGKFWWPAEVRNEIYLVFFNKLSR